MGTLSGDRKTRQRKSLRTLKRAAIVIAIFDLILAINDSRNVGRFFLLVTMSNTFDVTPENIIERHCVRDEDAIPLCANWMQMALTGSFSFPSEISGRKESPRKGEEALSMQRLTEIFKELVSSWKSTFDPSRPDTNIFFYFDDEEGHGMHEEKKHSFSLEGEKEDRNGGRRAEYHSPQPRRSRGNKEENILNLNQRKGESRRPHEYDPQPHLNSNVREEVDHDLVSGIAPTPSFSRDNDVTGTEEDTSISPHLSFPKNQEIGSSRTKRFSPVSSEVSGSNVFSASPSTVQAPIAGLNKDVEDEVIITTSPAASFTPSETTQNNNGKLLKNWRTGSKCNKTERGGGSDHLTQINSLRKGNKYNGGNFEPGGKGKCSSELGPKRMIGFLQQEVFYRWPSLIQNAKDLITSRDGVEEKGNANGNDCIDQQFGLPEADKLKMQIHLNPNTWENGERKVKATQQIFYDSPWLTMIQLSSDISGNFIKMFVVITLYTWVWGSVLALMLLLGTLQEDPMIVHAWIVFNILYSLLFFMVDDWINNNVNPLRSSASLWISIIHSVYKPLATWIVLMLWSELKKLLGPDTPSLKDGKGLKERAIALSNSSLSSDTTKESTIVDIAITTDLSNLNLPLMTEESNTATALRLAASRLGLGLGLGDNFSGAKSNSENLLKRDSGDYEENEVDDEEDDEDNNGDEYEGEEDDGEYDDDEDEEDSEQEGMEDQRKGLHKCVGGESRPSLFPRTSRAAEGYRVKH